MLIILRKLLASRVSYMKAVHCYSLGAVSKTLDEACIMKIIGASFRVPIIISSFTQIWETLTAIFFECYHQSAHMLCYKFPGSLFTVYVSRYIRFRQSGIKALPRSVIMLF